MPSLLTGQVGLSLGCGVGRHTSMGISDEALAFSVVAGAGMATTIGAGIVFVPKLTG